MTAVLLVNPKSPHNVGNAIRACSIYGVPWLRWTGSRISDTKGRGYAGPKGKAARLPREERMKDYLGIDWREDEKALDVFIASGLTPVAVEVRREAESLVHFEHPREAVYIFGPEDGSIPKGVRHTCHRFVRIPTLTRTPLNLAAAINIVLYDRFVKSGAVEWALRHAPQCEQPETCGGPYGQPLCLPCIEYAREWVWPKERVTTD